MAERLLKMALAMVCCFLLTATVPRNAQAVVDPIAQSHIGGNVPNEPDFNRFLQRYLEEYFRTRVKKPVKVAFEFLREGPTQTGIAFPKYYVWVKVTEGKKVIDEGAARVAAIPKQHFEVTDFMTTNEIKKNSKAVFDVFPRPVGEKILSRSK